MKILAVDLWHPPNLTTVMKVRQFFFFPFFSSWVNNWPTEDSSGDREEWRISSLLYNNYKDERPEWDVTAEEHIKKLTSSTLNSL